MSFNTVNKPAFPTQEYINQSYGYPPEAEAYGNQPGGGHGEQWHHQAGGSVYPNLPHLQHGGDDHGDHGFPDQSYNPALVTFNIEVSFLTNENSSNLETEKVDVDLTSMYKLWFMNDETNLLRKDFSKAVPVSVAIVGKTFPDGSPYNIRIYDKKSNKLHYAYSPFYSGNTHALQLEDGGYPLYLGNKTIYRNNKMIDENMRKYAHLTIDSITEGIVAYPHADDPYIGVPLATAHYFAWFIEVIQNRPEERVLTHPSYVDPASPKTYIRLSNAVYDDCVRYYKEQIASLHFHDLSKLSIELIPTSVVKEKDSNDHTATGGAAVKKDKKVKHSLMLSFKAYADDVSDPIYNKRVTDIGKGSRLGDQAALGKKLFSLRKNKNDDERRAQEEEYDDYEPPSRSKHSSNHTRK